MKKLLFSVGAIISIALCCCNGSKKSSPDQSSANFKPRIVPADSTGGGGEIVEETLNGVTGNDAFTGTNYFFNNRNLDQTPLNQDIWFDISVLKDICTLLDDETKAGTVKPDGIRFYFTSNPKGLVNGHLENNIVIVTTYGSGYETVGKTKVAIHSDYFEHSATEALFQNKLIKGTPSNRTDTLNGAVLYKDCVKCLLDLTCTVVPDHDISRRDAQALVRHFGKGAITSRGEWFDINMVKAFYAELVAENADGMRVYFAKHPTVDADGDKEAFVVTSTKTVTNSKGITIHKDFFDCLHPILKPARQGLNPGEDNGELCPDHCDGLGLP